MELNIQKHKITYNPKEKVFTSSSIGVAFGTDHILVNTKTGTKVKFELTHSTGSEWDNNTIWVFVSECKEYTLHLLNDDVTDAQRTSYLNCKLSNCGQ